MKKERILSVLLCVCLTAVVVFAFSVGINDCQKGVGAFAKSEDVYPVTAARMASKNVPAAALTIKVEDFTETETEAPETSRIESVEESEEDSEQEASEAEETISDSVRDETSETASGDERMGTPSEVAAESEVVQGDGRSVSGVGSVPFKAYGIWTGAYWHFTPEQIDAQWRGLKTSKPSLPQGTTRAWQSYLYDRLAGIGAEWFYKYAVAQAMQESGFNPLNQQGNDAVPDKGLFSFRIYYWNSAYGDVFDYHANINAYVDRIAPYLTDSSEQGIYRAISQHYQPNGQTNMTYVNQVLGRLNELWEVE